MSKTLATILHHNTTEYTDQLFEMLNPYKREDYDLIVIDNGSDEGKKSKYSEFFTDYNVYFGGGLNVAFDYVLDNPQYDSLLFLNSDLIVHGQNFVKTLRGEMGKYDVVSPSIIQPEKTQNHWQQMLNWNAKEIREVKWIDLQAPLFSRRFIEKVQRVDDLLIYGWGIDVLFGLVCEKEGWKTGVCDFVPAVHLGSATLKQMKIVNEYCRKAEEGQWTYFRKENIIKEVTDFRTWAENYKYERKEMSKV
jgi:hypothetical protein